MATFKHAISKTNPTTLIRVPGIGLKLGAEPRFERYQPSAIAAVCSRSFRDALQRIARYKQLTCPEEIRVRTTQDEAPVEFFYLQAEEVHPGVLVDLCLSWILSIGPRGTDGQVTPLRLELTRPVQQRELLETHFGCRVRFNADRNALVLRSSDLDRPFGVRCSRFVRRRHAHTISKISGRPRGIRGHGRPCHSAPAPASATFASSA